MIKNLILRYGKEKLNSLTKYPSILTLHELGERGKLTDKLLLQPGSEPFWATEKIDGTNVRILSYGGEWALGSREFLLYHGDDLFFDPAQGIVDSIQKMAIGIPYADELTVFYGELYGGRLFPNSKWYGQSKVGLRLFDVAVFSETLLDSVLSRELPQISSWRERLTDNGIQYGQPFLPQADAASRFPNFEFVPMVNFALSGTAHQQVLDSLRVALPKTNAALTDEATGRAEGIVIRNADRSKMAKIRFEDYERTLRQP